jgi:hypothetical protein
MAGFFEPARPYLRRFEIYRRWREAGGILFSKNKALNRKDKDPLPAREQVKKDEVNVLIEIVIGMVPIRLIYRQ